jgi:hypothetical protein
MFTIGIVMVLDSIIRGLIHEGLLAANCKFTDCPLGMSRHVWIDLPASTLEVVSVSLPLG